jgi:malate synthase
VTLRQILLSRAEKALDSKKTSDAKDALAELQALKTRQKFVEELASRQKSVIAEDVAVQQRIDALFAELIKLAEEQLDPKPIDALAAEVKRAK